MSQIYSIIFLIQVNRPRIYYSWKKKENFEHFYVLVTNMRKQGVDYLKYDNCNSDGSSETVRYIQIL